MASAMLSSFADKFYAHLQQHFSSPLLSWTTLIQLLIVVGALILAGAVTRATRRWCDALTQQCTAGSTICDDLGEIIKFLKIITPFLAFVLIWIAYRLAQHFHWPQEVLYMAGVLCIALTVVRLFTGQMTNRFLAKILQIIIWLWSLLFILHLTQPWFALLNNIDFSVGRFTITLLTVYRAILLALLLYWLSRKVILIWHCWLTLGSRLGPAIQILLYKLGSILIYVFAIALILHYMGLDLTIFTLFSGALGLGLGFGLQKIFANLVSGFIILADKSIKPGDVIQVGDQYGWINFLGSRYVSVVGRNGTEHLIPNENLITNEVINWSYSSNLVRISLPVGVAYDSDLEKVRDLMLEVAQATPRVLVDPKPSCLLMGFGDSTINLELRVWMNDPQNGIGRVKSELNWGIWKVFRENGIELPFPQRDVHLKSVVEVKEQEQEKKHSEIHLAQAGKPELPGS
jgi:small-conductance mechanosensitive channel